MHHSDLSASGSYIHDVSVVVCTHNRSDYLCRVIASLLQQRVHGRRFEVIVIDDGSTDATAAVVTNMRASSHIPIRYFYQDNAGIGVARNNGVREARAAWVAFIDDDVIASSDWLSELVNAAERENADLVGGPYILTPTGGVEIEPIGTIGRLLGQNPCMASPAGHLSLMERIRLKAGRLAIPAGGNVLIRKEVVEYLGGFSPMRYGEDQDLFRRALRAGARLAIACGAHGYHLTPPERFTRKYLYWLAPRAGRTQALIDSTEPSRLRLFFIAICRFLHLLAVTLPSLLWFAITNNKARCVSCSCSLRYGDAYLRQTIRSLII